MDSRNGVINFQNFKIVCGYGEIGANETRTINFYQAFNERCINVQFSRMTGTFDWDKSMLTQWTNTGFTIQNNGYAFKCYYVAIGY